MVTDISRQIGSVNHGCFGESHPLESQLAGGDRGEICAAESHQGVALSRFSCMRRSADFSLGPVLPTTSAKALPGPRIAMHFETERSS
jgi:hypothetical protein